MVETHAPPHPHPHVLVMTNAPAPQRFPHRSIHVSIHQIICLNGATVQFKCNLSFSCLNSRMCTPSRMLRNPSIVLHRKGQVRIVCVCVVGVNRLVALCYRINTDHTPHCGAALSSCCAAAISVVLSFCFWLCRRRKCSSVPEFTIASSELLVLFCVLLYFCYF